MIKLKYGIATVVVTLMALFTQTSYAECFANAAHLSIVTTLHVSQYGTNYPLDGGDISFNKVNRFGCNGMGRVQAVRFTGPKSLTKIDVRGKQAWLLPSTVGGEQTQLAIEPLVTSNVGLNIVADGEQSNVGSTTIDGGFWVFLVSTSNLMAPPGVSSVTFNIAEPVAYLSYGVENFSTEYPAIYLDNITVNYVLTSCGIKAKQGSTINWPNLYKKDIVNGTAESKPYSLSLICGDDSAPASPINISFSSTNGFADAANGVVNTNLANLGLKLSWANPALPPLVLDQVNHSMLSGVGDYTVLAKPVKLSNLTDALQAGQFDTTVTMNIEFQ